MTERLVSFINSHDMCRVERVNPNGTLDVSSEVVHIESRKMERVTETIPATISAARDWLGY